jgi:hypothetical protein
MIEAVCKKELRRLALPDVIILEIIKFCSWVPVPRIHMWYIIASKVDSSRLDRAKQLDTLSTFLSTNDDDDILEVFTRNITEHVGHIVDYVRHFKMNQTI